MLWMISVLEMLSPECRLLSGKMDRVGREEVLGKSEQEGGW